MTGGITTPGCTAIGRPRQRDRNARRRWRTARADGQDRVRQPAIASSHPSVDILTPNRGMAAAAMPGLGHARWPFAAEMERRRNASSTLKGARTAWSRCRVGRSRANSRWCNGGGRRRYAGRKAVRADVEARDHSPIATFVRHDPEVLAGRCWISGSPKSSELARVHGLRLSRCRPITIASWRMGGSSSAGRSKVCATARIAARRCRYDRVDLKRDHRVVHTRRAVGAMRPDRDGVVGADAVSAGTRCQSFGRVSARRLVCGRHHGGLGVVLTTPSFEVSVDRVSGIGAEMTKSLAAIRAVWPAVWRRLVGEDPRRS